MDETTTWHPAGPAEDAPDETLRRVETGGRAVCLGRVDGTWVAFDDTCTHEECPLSDGYLEGAVVVCPCHGSEFDVHTGEVLSPPAFDPLPIYEVRVAGDALEVRFLAPGLAAAALEEPEEPEEPEEHQEPEAVSETVSGVAEPSIDGLELDDIDLSNLDAWAVGVPHAWLAKLRREAPLRWQDEPDGSGYWSLTRYDDIVAVSKDFATFSSETGGTSLEDLTPSQVELRKSMLDTDPPAHTRMRAIVNKGFTPKVVNAYEQRIRGLAREILAKAFERTRYDFVEDVAAELPMWVFSEIMGLPVADRKLLIELGDKLLGNTDPEVVGEEYTFGSADLTAFKELPFSSPFSRDLIEYGRRLGEQRRHEPRDDVTTKLIEAEVDGERLDEREFGVFFILLTTAGNETTRHTISLGLLALLDHPEEAARLRADPGLASTAADEILRVGHPVHHFRRTATRDVELHGQTIRAGDKVVIWYASGNFDEDRFADPYRFDVGRTPNRHLAFGLGGPHFCLGAHLARLEVKIWLEEMIPYLDRIELDGAPERLRSNFFNGIKRLPVRVRA